MPNLGRVGAHLRRHWRAHLAIHTTWIAALAVAFALGAFSGAAYRTFTVHGAHGARTLKVPAKTFQQAAAAFTHDGARNQAPADAPAAAIRAAERQDQRLAAHDQLPRVFPDAAPEQRGCVTELVQDYSSRNGVAPHAFVLHYTVSPNVPGWADVNAIVGLFNTWSFQASSNYVLDAEGHCAYIVRETDKAWTQAAANPVAISVEVIDTGYEKTFLPPAGMAKLAMIISDACARWHIPVRLGAFQNGVLTQAGILDHDMLGLAGGGHHDIAPLVNGQFDHAAGLARVRQVIAAVRAFRRAQAAARKPAKPAPELLSENGAGQKHLNLPGRR